MKGGFKKLVVVTRKTRLQELVERFNTKAQAKFYIEHAGGNFQDYEAEDDVYRRALERLLAGVALGLKVHVIDRGLVPTYTFTDHDLVMAVGQDGLVANCAKYIGRQPLVGVNPDPERIDGILLPFGIDNAVEGVKDVLEEKPLIKEVTLAEVTLNDGQRLLAFNDFFIGPKSHISARYRVGIDQALEKQSSSGIIVSTGAGSTGWLSSVFNMAAGVARFLGGETGTPQKMGWDDPRLTFVVREPFISRHSAATLVSGVIQPGHALVVESNMPMNGVIFSDGIEADYLEFNSGFTARIRPAEQQARLVGARGEDDQNR